MKNEHVHLATKIGFVLGSFALGLFFGYGISTISTHVSFLPSAFLAQVIDTPVEYDESGFGSGPYGGLEGVEEESGGGGGGSGGGGGGGSRSSSSSSDDDEDTVETTETTTTATDTSTTEEDTSPATPVVATKVRPGFTFSRNISFNQPQFNISDDVSQLQTFLNDFEGESLSIDGNYGSEDNAAVKRFQEKYKREILDVWNLTEATGYVGITTRLKMNFLLKGQTAQCPVFTEYNGGLNGIMVSSEVGETQKILRDLDMYSGSINNTWDAATNKALMTFQETFKEVMLDPWDITEGTGYKYKTTNKFLNYFAGCDTGSVYLEGVGTYEGI